MKEIGILGGGISGLSLAANLKKEYEILEKAPECGGLCSSIIEDGFTFDAAGPHILFSKNEKVLQYMVSMLGDNVEKQRRNNKIWFKGHYVKYPFENGLSDLPKEDCFECIRDYLGNDWSTKPTNLEEWAYFTFGKSIADKYFLPYNKKIWNCDPAKMSLDWVSRIPKPPMEDVLKSAIGIETEGYLHQLHFYYPKFGGYQSIVKAFENQVQGHIKYNNTIEKIIKTGDGWLVKTDECNYYKNIVSTIPIHTLVKILKGVPQEAIDLSNKLRYNSLINVLVGFKTDFRELNNLTALYVPDPNILFHRLSFPKNFNKNNVPVGRDAIMAEITTNEGDGIWELSDEEILSRTISDYNKISVLEDKDIVYKKVVRFKYGYPVYTLDYNETINKLRQILQDLGIILLGRFGQFDYINSDVCVERALILANKLNQFV